MQHTVTISRMQAAGAPARLSRFAHWADRHFKWLLVAPAVLLILALSIYPLLFSLWVSFVNYDFQVPGHAFVGLKNFERVVFDPVARWSLLLTAACRDQRRQSNSCSASRWRWPWCKTFRGRGMIMSLLIMPLFISPVIVGQAWALLLQRPFGPTNYILSAAARPRCDDRLADPDAVESSSPLIIADVWQWTPFMFVILLAGLTAIPPEPL